MKKTNLVDWLLRFVKGIFIGSGFILPGVSGGALAAVFGIYERIIMFLANLTKNFKENIRFFLPVGLGGLTGIFIFSFAVSFLLGNYETTILWFFVGCIVGTVPALWREAGKKGRSDKDMINMVVTFILFFLFLKYGEHLFTTNLVQNVWTWLLAGALIGLGMIVPGLSPSNFLIYLGMYKAMSDGIKNLDFAVIIPLGIGAVLCVLLLSKLVNLIIQKAYSTLFHFILGVVFASTVIIIPVDYSGLNGWGILACVILFELGILLGWWMSDLENRYK
ncbi:DUF368 domain-containing protein [Amphibacillus sp. MSJ-3]|uniref:DUF368 domain-containing protein n=1 Tax=Amphibacillus sp. MSJ-3 TaxID=2841505 RepID=UPI001C0F38BC|nr:DUF368 domain-containing protein [Amphibacillus sp. MSJ-3]MBU5595493.1 DUF368 domain-containing protein [Amphibacillus sp. MSJ-3]